MRVRIPLWAVNASLLQILLSGISGAMLATVGNHIFSQHREQVKLLTEKLEDLLACLDELRARSTLRSLVVTSPPNTVTTVKESYYTLSGWDITSKLQSLVILHFPMLQAELNVILKKNEDYVSALKEAKTPQGRFQLKVLPHEIFNAAETMERKILAQSGYLTGKWREGLAKWWCRKCAGLA